MTDELPPAVPVPDAAATPAETVRRELKSLRQARAGEVAARTLEDVGTWLRLSPRERAAHDWGEPPSRDLDALFPVADALGAIHALLRDPEPTPSAADALAMGCHRVAGHAETMGAAATATLFRDAAARLAPRNARLAYEVGRLARKLGAGEHAAAWLERAAALGEDAGHWEARALALLALAALRTEAGDGDEALRLLDGAVRAARRGRRRVLAGDACYRAALLHLERGELKAGARRAAAALDSYGEGHGRIPALAADCAWAMLDRFGDPESAQRVLNALEGHVHPPARGLFLLAMRVRAAAALDWEPAYEAAVTELEAERARAPTDAGHAASLVQAARAAVSFGMWPRAEVAAAEALRIATARGEARWEKEAGEVLAALRRPKLSQREMEGVFPEAGYQEPPPATPDAAALADALAAALEPPEDGAPAGAVGRLLAGRG